MYIVFKNNEDIPYVFKFQTAVAQHIGCCIHTMYYHKGDTKWQYKEYVVYNTDKVYLMSNNKGKW
jgi:hypothetical protein